jgi:16S rRNA (adenine1518-N6/adenine1519-N6)-dimethyltransferase
VEIGPGQGALTQRLLEAAGSLEVIEIDRDLAALLRNRYAGQPRFVLHQADALQVDWRAMAAARGARLRLIGNLPYNISTPLLFHLLQFAPLIRDLHFMLQKEVVERMVAAPSTPAYGRLSVMLQLHFEMENLFEVPPLSFEPPPKVDSAVVRMRPIRRDLPDGFEPAWFGQVVAAAFGQRRKTLRNSLQKLVEGAGGARAVNSGKLLEQAGIDPRLRAENLGVEDYLRLSVALTCSR